MSASSRDIMIGQVPLVLLFTLLGSCFSLVLGLLLGSLLKTTSAAGAAGLFSFVYIVPVFLTGVFGNLYSKPHCRRSPGP